jgi:hypothetical protein
LATELQILRAMFPGEIPEHISCTQGLLDVFDDDEEWPELGVAGKDEEEEEAAPAVERVHFVTPFQACPVPVEDQVERGRTRTRTRASSWFDAQLRPAQDMTASCPAPMQTGLPFGSGSYGPSEEMAFKRRSCPLPRNGDMAWSIQASATEHAHEQEERDVKRCVHVDMRGVTGKYDGVYHLSSPNGGPLFGWLRLIMSGREPLQRDVR